MKAKILSLACSVVLLLALLAFPVGADMGPKPSVTVNFDGLSDRVCYATLLSDREHVGPYSVWDGIEENGINDRNYPGELEYGIWKAFADYRGCDGYCFLQRAWRVDKTKSLTWGYMPPDNFRILLYFPESGEFAVSGTYERYAFHTYYTVDMRDYTAGSGTLPKAERSYSYTNETISLIARIVLTIGIELVIALLFRYRSRRQVKILLITNMITQVILNVFLNVVNYTSGSLAFILMYINAEIIVFVIEAVIYAGILPEPAEGEKPKRGKAVLYALTANAVSFALGFAIAWLIPGIF